MPKVPKIMERMMANRNHPKPMAPMFNVAPQTETTPAEIVLYGDVLEEVPRDWWTGEPIDGMHITVEDMLVKMEEVRDASEITIRLNSSGGDLFAGIAIHNLLKSFAGHKTVVVDGLAASAASAIMCAGDTVKVHPSSMIMVHNVASMLMGYYNIADLDAVIHDMEAAEDSLVRLYEAKCKKPRNEIKDMLDATTWMVGTDAIDEGFADELIETAMEESDPEVTEDGQFLMVAGIRHSLYNLGSIPERITSPFNASAFEDPVSRGQKNPAETEKEVEMTFNTVADLRRELPDLVSQIESDAVAAERARIRAIEDIQSSIANPTLVNRAKFEEPMDAAQLALANLQEQAKVQETFLAALEADGTDSHVDEVMPEPAISADEEIELNANIDAAIASAVEIYNKEKEIR